LETLIQLEDVEHKVLEAIPPEAVKSLIDDVELLIRLDDEEPQTHEELRVNLAQTAQTLLKIGKDHMKMIRILNKLSREKWETKTKASR
jgi:hypothetical protein